MTGMHALWMPIVLSAVAVFVVSSLLHMVLAFWHAGDYLKVPSQDGVMDALRPFAIPPGDYMMPRSGGMQEMRTPEFQEKMSKGPVIFMTVMPNGMMGMGRSLSLWFVYTLVISAFAAYVAGRALPVGADYMRVFLFVCITAFLGYTAALWQAFIWYHKAIGTTIRSTIDGLIYAALSAGIFGWLWPH